MKFWLCFVFSGACLWGCSPSQAPVDLSPSALVERGRAVYQSNCTSCHASNPSSQGPVGPALAGSSLELLTHRLQDRSYPQGYTPQRSTSIMPAFPHLVKEAQALQAYLNQK